MDVVRDADLTLNEKRALLASWASDALSVKHTTEPLRDDPVASINDTCVARGNCGEVAESMVLAGLTRVVDFQDVASGKESLDLTGEILTLDDGAMALCSPHRDTWLLPVRSAAARDCALAVDLLKARRLVKGYSDTHPRGPSKFDKVTAAAAKLEGRPDAVDWDWTALRGGAQG